MKNVVSIMVSADWHIGATDPYRFREELINTVENVIRTRRQLDLFIVAGDVFDMKEYLSSDSVKVFFLIMVDLLNLTKEYNTEFRFIEGTRTHDALQLSTLSIIFNQLIKNDKIKFIEEVSTENILGLDILYIPEEYVTDSEMYYKEYFSNHYDFIFGHGNTDLMWYMKKDKKYKISSAPVFNTEELCTIANYSYFGHFHYHTKGGIDNRFKSIGPVSRWEFDKDGDCGLYYVEYDINTKIAFENYVVNEYAPILSTVIFNVKQNYELDVLNRKIKEKINPKLDSSDKVRLIVNIDTSLDTFIVMRDFILSAYGNVDRLTLMMKLISPEVIEENNIVETKSIEESIEEKPYLYNKSMHDEAKIASFIRTKDGVNIPLENILEVILKKDNKIKNRED